MNDRPNVACTRRLEVGRPGTVLVAGFISLLISLLAVTTAIGAALYTYDAPTNARVDALLLPPAEASPAQLSAAQEVFASPSIEPRGTSTTSPRAFPATESISTPYGAAGQGTDAASIAARSQVEGGATMYRTGTLGRSAGPEGQFWSLEHPSTPGYASRYGLPAENVANADFIESAVLRPGAPYITRAAPGIGENVGGGIEVVINTGDAVMCAFSYLGTKAC